MDQQVSTVQTRYRKRRPQEKPARGLILLWCLWVMGNWLFATLFYHQHYVHATRWLMFACMFGMMILWPALRLSQEIDRPMAISQMLWDWFSLNLAFQVVIWPMKISAQWSLPQTLWLNAAMASWSLLVGAILAQAVYRSGGVTRAMTMAMCVLLIFGELVIAVFISMMLPDLGNAHWPILFSPIEVLILLTANPPKVAPVHILSIAMLGFAGWLTLAALQRRAV